MLFVWILISFLMGIICSFLFLSFSKDVVILEDNQKVVEKDFLDELQKRYSFLVSRAGLEDSDF